MSSETRTMGELREQLVEKATGDEAFRARLISDPKAAIEESLGLTVPPGFTIEVHEDSPGAGHLVLPPSASLGESELGRAAGGFAGDPSGESPDDSWDR